MQRIILVLGLILVAPLSLLGENWPQWRGPHFNGSGDETNLLVQWDTTNNIKWVGLLPGYSSATPAIWGDFIFLPSPDEHNNLLLQCWDRTNGVQRWQKAVAHGNREKGRNNMASPSPVTDGQKVVGMFATGDIAAFDFTGKQLWKRDLGAEYGRFAINWIYGSSPLLYEGKLYIEVLQQTPVPSGYAHAQDSKPDRDSYLLCLDPATGTNLWRHIRPTDAISESFEAYTTPIPLEGKKGTEIIVAGGNYVTAHSAVDGAELWRCGGLNDRNEPYWRLVPSPVIADGLIIACGPKRDPVLAIKDGGTGLVTSSNIVWKFKEYPSDCVTPLYYQGKLFVLDGDRQMVTRLEPKTGNKVWQGSLGVREIFRASPTGADGKLYCISEEGTVVILSAGDEFKVISTIHMGEAPVRASIAVSQGDIYIRTAKHLYCVGTWK